MKILKTNNFKKQALTNYDRGHVVGPEPQNDNIFNKNDEETEQEIKKKWKKKEKGIIRHTINET